MLMHIILMVSGTMSIGYLVHLWLYWREMHAIVPLRYDMCSGVDLMIALAVAGFIMAWF